MFKQLLLVFIKLYWRCIPVPKRRPCIFRESCSQYVYRTTSEDGFLPGIKAFIKRYRQCRPGYRLGYNTSSSKDEVLLKDGSVVNKDELRADIDFFKPI